MIGKGQFVAIGADISERPGFSGDDWQEVIDAAVGQIEEDGGPEWAKIRRGDPETAKADGDQRVITAAKGPNK